MATFDFVIDESSIAATIGPANGGYLVNLSMTTAPSGHVVPDADPARQRFTSGYLTLQSTRGLRPLINVTPSNGFTGAPPLAQMLVNSSIGYVGDLMVVGVPRGATFAITLSDQPNIRAPRTPEWNFNNANYKPHNPPARPKTPQGASTARKAGAILHAARTPAE